MVFNSSRKSGMYYGFHDLENPSLESSKWDLKKLAEDMQKNCDWQTNASSPTDEMERALRLLEQEVL